MTRKNGSAADGFVQVADSKQKKKNSKKGEQRQKDLPVCLQCGTGITEEVMALNCDKCQEPSAWKCAKCLDISVELYSSLDNTVLHWFCDRCEKRVMTDTTETGDSKGIAVMEMLEKLMEKMNQLDNKLDEKADAKLVQQLQDRIEKLEMKSHEERKEVRTEDKSGEQTTDGNALSKMRQEMEGLALEQGEIERRKHNLIIYRVPEAATENVEKRKDNDMSFFSGLCTDALELEPVINEVAQLIRLGKKNEDGRPRPLLVKLKTESKKVEIMTNLRKLKTADETYRRISVAHDLTPRQRENIRKSLDEAKKKHETDGGDGAENYKYRVVGPSTKPRIVLVRT